MTCEFETGNYNKKKTCCKPLTIITIAIAALLVFVAGMIFGALIALFLLRNIIVFVVFAIILALLVVVLVIIQKCLKR